MNKEEYDSEPVYYCKRCLSLNVQEIPALPGQAYCADCGDMEIETTDIQTWMKLYRDRYGKDLIEHEDPQWPYW